MYSSDSMVQGAIMHTFIRHKSRYRIIIKEFKKLEKKEKNNTIKTTTLQHTVTYRIQRKKLTIKSL